MTKFAYTTRMIATVYGVYNHGSKAGQVNPASQVTMTVYGTCYKHARRKLEAACDGALYTVQAVQEGDFGSFYAFGDEVAAIERDMVEQAKSDEKFQRKLQARMERQKRAA